MGKFNDGADMKDALTASLETIPTKASFPCGKCGAETKAHHPILDEDTGDVVTKRRICSRRDCRCIVDGS